MATIRNFGDAVHAVIPYMKKGGKPLLVQQDALQEVLDRYMASSCPYAPDELERILACWHYIAELVALATWVRYEPCTSSGERPDLLLGGEDTVCILEIKTVFRALERETNLPTRVYHLRIAQRARVLERAEEQIDAMVQDIRDQKTSFSAQRVLGAVVMFYADLDEPFMPVYQLMCDVDIVPPPE